MAGKMAESFCKLQCADGFMRFLTPTAGTPPANTVGSPSQKVPGSDNMKKEFSQQCGICNQLAAIVYCQACGGCMCETCDGEVHSWGVLAKHTRQQYVAGSPEQLTELPPAKVQNEVKKQNNVMSDPQDESGRGGVDGGAGSVGGHSIQHGDEQLVMLGQEKAGFSKGWTREYAAKEVLLGITIGFAQVPESVAFAFLANVKPPIALHAAWMVGLVCSLFGGRPAMVNGATGAFAAIISTFLPKPEEQGGNGDGVELLFPSVILAGVLMLVTGGLNLSRFILMLPAPVMIGFCNGLAVVIGLAQLHPFKDHETHGWKSGMELIWMLVITTVSMVAMEFLPKLPLKIFKVIPSSLVSIILAMSLEFAIVRPSGGRTDTIGDISKFTSDTAFPIPFFVDHVSTDYDFSKLTEKGAMQSIAIQGFLLALVGSIESLMTSEVVESYVHTPSDGQKTLFAMGAGNMISGVFGGMGGNAMIGLSTINVLNGGRGRLAPTCTALLVMVAIMGAYPILNFIPVAALAGIMLVVVLHTFKWFSIKMLLNVLPKCARDKLGMKSKVPRIEVVVIVLVTLLSIFLNIAYAVVAGVAVCSMAHAWNSGSQLQVKIVNDKGKKIYNIDGPLFFTSANRLVKLLTPEIDPNEVELFFGESALMDYTAIKTLHGVAAEYKSKGKHVVFKSLNPSSQSIIQKANDLVSGMEWTPKVTKVDAEHVDNDLMSGA